MSSSDIGWTIVLCTLITGMTVCGVNFYTEGFSKGDAVEIQCLQLHDPCECACAGYVSKHSSQVQCTCPVTESQP